MIIRVVNGIVGSSCKTNTYGLDPAPAVSKSSSSSEHLHLSEGPAGLQ